MTYETRYCAFVDILGFSQIIGEVNRGTLRYEDLRATLQTVHEPPLADFPSFGDTGFRAQSISDAVCLSANPTREGLVHLLLSLEALTLALLDKGYFLRGAVVRGFLYHDDKMVFGDALVRAYRLESTVARYPRILLSREVVENYREFGIQGGEDLNDFVRQAEDGPHYLHALQIIPRVFRDMAEQDERMNQIHRYNFMAAKIQQSFNVAVDDPRVFEKVQWFAKYWNDTVRQFGGSIHRIDGPGVGPPPMV